MGTIKRVDQFNTEQKNITVDMKNITDNRIQRKEKKHEKREVCGKQKPVCLGDVCSQVLGVELNMESEKERCSSPELCSTAEQTFNDSCSPVIEDNISPIQNTDGNKSKSKNNSSGLQEIYSQLLKEDCSKSMADKTSPPRICTSIAQTKNDVSINHQHPKSSNHFFSNSKIVATNEGRLLGYFCSDTVFNLSNRYEVCSYICVHIYG